MDLRLLFHFDHVNKSLVDWLIDWCWNISSFQINVSYRIITNCGVVHDSPGHSWSFMDEYTLSPWNDFCVSGAINDHVIRSAIVFWRHHRTIRWFCTRGRRRTCSTQVNCTNFEYNVQNLLLLLSRSVTHVMCCFRSIKLLAQLRQNKNKNEKSVALPSRQCFTGRTCAVTGGSTIFQRKGRVPSAESTKIEAP